MPKRATNGRPYKIIWDVLVGATIGRPFKNDVEMLLCGQSRTPVPTKKRSKISR